MAGTCFVVQGFGKKVDYKTGRTLDLDASYEVIKDAVEAAGLTCIRADEIQHSGSIEVPMYEQLHDADLVIADLSTSNVNAAYELGVRHALRPFTTLIVAETQFTFPFDVNHIAIRTYTHLGEDVGRREAKRFQAELTEAIDAILGEDKTDSPVYTFLHKLQPPAPAADDPADDGQVAKAAGDGKAETLRMLMDAFKEQKDQGNWKQAIDYADMMLVTRPGDPYLIQQKALATYKAEDPTEVEALRAARGVLEILTPHSSNDTETLGIWGAVHKRLWQAEGRPEDLDEALRSYARGFYIKNDYYNGINAAFMHDVRAAEHARGGKKADSVADSVIARRLRLEVLGICTAGLDDADDLPPDDVYWITATAYEAQVGLGNAVEAAGWKARAEAAETKGWMRESTRKQIASLEELLEQSLSID